MGGPTQKGIVQYSVSPFQQNAMRGALHSYVFYGFKRIMQQAPYFALPFAVGKFLTTIAFFPLDNVLYTSLAWHEESKC